MKKIIEKMVGCIMGGVAFYIILNGNYQSSRFLDYEKNILAFLMIIIGVLLCFAEPASVEKFYADEKEKEELETEISFVKKMKI